MRRGRGAGESSPRVDYSPEQDARMVDLLYGQPGEEQWSVDTNAWGNAISFIRDAREARPPPPPPPPPPAASKAPGVEAKPGKQGELKSNRTFERGGRTRWTTRGRPR